MTTASNDSSSSRRDAIQMLAGGFISMAWLSRSAPTLHGGEVSAARLKGLVVVPDNLSLDDWPGRVKRAGLNTICLHHWASANAIVQLIDTDLGQKYVEQCQHAGLDMEFDFHAMSDLVPRDLFTKDQSLFRAEEDGNRTARRNFCVHSKNAMAIAVNNARVFAKKLPTTTGCYYYWSDGCAAWCRCPQCRELSDSDQQLMVENAIVAGLRQDNPAARVAHLACHASMPRPTKIQPAEGVFLQFAPGRRRYDIPYSQQNTEPSLDGLWFLERNLEVFSAESAQILEYWLDVTRFKVGDGPLPWNREWFLQDLATYRRLGIKDFKSFGNGLNASYLGRHGELFFLKEFADGLAVTH